jgi:hypothetical protein
MSPYRTSIPHHCEARQVLRGNHLNGFIPLVLMDVSINTLFEGELKHPLLSWMCRDTVANLYNRRTMASTSAKMLLDIQLTHAIERHIHLCGP